MNSSVFARSAIRSRILARPVRDGAYHWENVDGSVSSNLILFSSAFPYYLKSFLKTLLLK